MTELNVNDLVEWTSQARGSTKKKQGKIVYVLKAKEDIPIRVAYYKFPNHKRMFDGLSIPHKAKIGYLVEVEVGPKAAKRLYMPYPAKLRKIK